MLASITPLGERGRNATWSITVTAFAVGATVAGAALGAALGWVGSLLLPGGLGREARLVVLAGAVALAIALDVVPRGVPGPRRQVNERWLDEYRGWVYGLGYGAQLGLGVTTVVSSAGTYVAMAAALLTGLPGAGALIMGCFGAIRGLTLLAGAGVRTPPQLLAMHRAMGRWQRRARWGGVGVLAAMLAVAVAWLAG
ncbi:MAG TPA: hypothetical protein VE650_15385 [Acetobacteraceae bacterium]|nr:hypothetical protein [Acetobacteraceae bacterium]